ncbi:lysophospholipid acyltransferase family protein [Elongatibacter sediminis]|uniref:Lysophospholipid acyltransferase family protein n=1 Tax=Elongatibacter sediminis TaxID=3119006 RepID=A0AAW9RPS7_9GAMM
MIRLARALLWLLSLLPAAGPSWLARVLRRPWQAASPGKRAVAETNLRRCYPDMDPATLRRYVDDSFRHYVCTVLETGRNWYWPVRRLEQLCEEVVGEEQLREGLNGDRGLVVLAPHFGAWEYLGMYLQQFSHIAILYKKPTHEGLARALLERRRRGGALLLAADPSGLRRLYTHVRAGKGAGVLPDQEPSAGQGRFAPFFGVPALTGVLAPRLLQKTGARAIFTACERRPGGRYRIHVIEPDEEIYSSDLDQALAAVNRGVEQCIAVDPAQYLWSYKRFRSRPEGQPSFYD